MEYESDLLFLHEALPDLQEYILSSEIYWRLAVGSSRNKLPQLTIGNLALSLARLEAAAQTGEMKAEFDQLKQQIQQLRSAWLANWRVKGGREFGARLNLWQQYMHELRGDPSGQWVFYSTEVRKRAILTLLNVGDHADISGTQNDQLAMLDQILRGLTQPGPFVWEKELSDGFPEDTFWFLYVSINVIRQK
jgi:hypothetical protein